ncbi:hypothetical protein R3P38DRAFT_3041116 [Favolaschia claudopus]|uniref:Uncharacterized protein n=1 Tax=Favolaschia claudopus TaxID=2862362 RepID=A0AAW0AC07_9AGAR
MEAVNLIRHQRNLHIKRLRLPSLQTRPKRRPPSPRIMRHPACAGGSGESFGGVFRAVAGAEGTESGGARRVRVKASLHLARTRMYGGDEVIPRMMEGEDGREQEEGWREASELIEFVAKRGAKIPQMKHVQIEGEWAALSSDALRPRRY